MGDQADGCSRHKRSLVVDQILHACQSSSVLTSSFMSSPGKSLSSLSATEYHPGPDARANSAPHARYPVLLPHVVKVVTNHLAQIVDPHHGDIGPHCGQSINRCIPVVHRLFIGKEHGDLYLLCPGDRPSRGTFDLNTPAMTPCFNVNIAR